jgi:hypothetical protein
MFAKRLWEELMTNVGWLLSFEIIGLMFLVCVFREGV